MSTYETCERRNIERSTASHNVVQVDDKEQSEIWGVFRVARRARILERCIQDNTVSASCRNYDGSYIHRRRFDFMKAHVTMFDSVDVSNSCSGVTARFHLHPDIHPVLKNNIVTMGSMFMSFKGADKVELFPYEYAPEFNKLVPATCVEVKFTGRLETNIAL